VKGKSRNQLSGEEGAILALMDCLAAVQKQIIKFCRDAKVKRLWRERLLEKERKKERYQFWKLPH
jgi:hypothetical protein